MEKNSSNYHILIKAKNNSKKKLTGIMFTRSCCSIGIVFYHFFGLSKGKFKLLRKTANSTWGFIFVTIFFSISGSVFYYNYPKIKSIKGFYFKRWKSILLPYYICFFYFFLQNVFFFHKLFYKGHWSKLIFTLFGLDGFLNYRFKTYYIIGEWFLGALIIIYLIYPILTSLISQNILIIHFIIYFCYLLMYKTNFFIISKDKNMFSSINSFYFGMLGIKFSELFLNKISFLLSFILFIYLYFIKISNFILIFQIQGFALYIILVQIGQYIMSSRVQSIFIEVNNISYFIFLVHHKIILKVLAIYNPTKYYLQMELLGITIILTIICSKIFFIINNSIIQSNIIKKMESFFLKV